MPEQDKREAWSQENQAPTGSGCQCNGKCRHCRCRPKKESEEELYAWKGKPEK